ncbi:MAG TPA: AAA family ATPase, partial [Pirellulales bacterium]
DVEALEAIDRLHRRYASYSAPPGRPLRFLDNLLRDRPSGAGTVSADEVGRAFSRETGLPRVLLDDSERLDLAETRRWFGSRIAGQSAAVELVVELIAAVKAGLTRPGRPIASLLFIGPTGVGKTETAKALAEFLYQDPQRMVRFDMSEYADPWSIDRLVGGSFAQQGLLTAKVREQPFGVLLFDEFEKADPLFFDLLLQILGDGRLTDSVGRTADFSNAVIVMTSNLGAEEFQRASIGFDDSRRAGAAQEHFSKKVRDFLRPEIYNRIDRIVPFAPLDPAMLLSIARRQLDAIRRRDGLQGRNLAFEVPEDVLVALAKSAYDPRYGARPLVRAMERTLLTPLAVEINRWPSTAALTASADLHSGSVNVHVEPKRDLGGRVREATDDFAALMQAGDQATALRRDAQRLAGAGTLLALRNAVEEMEAFAKQQARVDALKRGRPSSWEAFTPQPKYKRYRDALDRSTALLDAATALEESVLLDFYARRPGDPHDARQRCAEYVHEFNQLLLDVYLVDDPAPSEALLVVFGDDAHTTIELTLAYLEVVKRQNGLASCWLLNRATTPEPATGVVRLICLPPPAEAGEEDDDEPEAKRRASGNGETNRGPRAKGAADEEGTAEDGKSSSVEKPTEIDAVRLEPWALQHAVPALGAALSISVRAARALFQGENGVHVFRRNGRDSHCFVAVGPNSLQRYRPPHGVERRGTFESLPRRRSYDWDKARIQDATLGAWTETAGALVSALHETTVTLLARRLREEVLG